MKPILIPALAATLALGGLSVIALSAPLRAETAVAPQENPPGDIPDSQVFITYTSDAHYHLKVPEGWARSVSGTDVAFADKLDTVGVTLGKGPGKPDVAWARKTYAPAMEAKGRALKISDLTLVKLPGGEAVEIAYSANSEPNAVTGKQVRLEAKRYLFFRGGMVAALDLTAPYGADNVDQWQLMSRSFGWQ